MSLLIFKYDGFYVANIAGGLILDCCGFFWFLPFGEILLGVDADILTVGVDADILTGGGIGVGDDGDDGD